MEYHKTINEILKLLDTQIEIVKHIEKKKIKKKKKKKK